MLQLLFYTICAISTLLILLSSYNAIRVSTTYLLVSSCTLTKLRLSFATSLQKAAHRYLYYLTSERTGLLPMPMVLYNEDMRRYAHTCTLIPPYLRSSLRQHKGNAFKVAVFDRWVVILTGSELINEVQRLPDEVVSFAHGICDVSATSV